MAPENLEIEAAQSWLARARSSLLLARQAPQPGVFPEDLAIQSQQAAQKAIRAVYLRFGLAFGVEAHNFESALLSRQLRI